MLTRRLRTSLVPGLVGVLLLTAMSSCSNNDERLTVFAAASLRDAFTDLAEGYRDAHPGEDVELSFAGSSSLREQVLAGAPADVIASADRANIDRLIAAGAAAEPTVFASNHLVLGVRAGNPLRLTEVADLARTDLLVGLCAPEVPCGSLALAVLEQAEIEPSLDTQEPDVRALLTKLEAGELDIGLVYASDARGNTAVDGIELSADVDVRTDYVLARITEGDRPARAQAFIDFVTSAEGQATLRAHGFGSP